MRKCIRWIQKYISRTKQKTSAPQLLTSKDITAYMTFDGGIGITTGKVPVGAKPLNYVTEIDMHVEPDDMLRVHMSATVAELDIDLPWGQWVMM